MNSDRVSAIPTEARSHQGMRAGIVSRVLANSADFALLLIALVGSYGGWLALRFLANPTGFTITRPSFLLALLLGAVYLFLYFTLSWATTGRTYGDHLMGLRVVSFRGEKLHWSAAVARAAFCTAFPLGLFWTIISNQNRSVQDVVLRTSVIYDWSLHGADS